MNVRYLHFAYVAVLTLGLAGSPLAVSQAAQTSGATPQTKCPTKENQPNTQSTGSAANDTSSSEGNWAEAFARTFQYDYQFIEQPSRVLVQSGSVTQLVPNPEYNLNQHSFTFDFSQMFLDKDLDTARKNCVAIRPWKSFVNGITLKAQLAEHPRVVQQMLLPANSFVNDYNIGGEADFDPAKVFKDYSTSAEHPARAIWQVAVPKISFKRVTPFDLVKYSGALVPQSTQNGLNTIEMTWDARRLLRPKRIMPADQTAKATADEKICVILFVNSKSYIGLPKEESASACKKLADSLGHKPFQLGCSSKAGATWGAALSQSDEITSSALPVNNECHWDAGTAVVADAK
jgi:hypothetical protein